MDLDDFRALARSSPWLWRTLQFTMEFEKPVAGRPGAMRAFVRRPSGVRVEHLDGTLVQASWHAAASMGYPEVEGPVRRPDGLIARRGASVWPADV